MIYKHNFSHFIFIIDSIEKTWNVNNIYIKSFSWKKSENFKFYKNRYAYFYLETFLYNITKILLHNNILKKTIMFKLSIEILM